MMDQSFDPFGGNTSGLPMDNGWGSGGGGGVGDASFSATQATAKANDFDRVTLPVTVATLNNLESTAEKIQFGIYSFSQVRVIGEVVSSSIIGQEIRYMIRDYGNEAQNPFLIVQYFGVDATNLTPLIEGTSVQVIGKIRTFDDQSAIIAFKVIEIPDVNMREVFPKEARVAELYFTKNVPERYANGEMADFAGTFLSPEAPQSNNRANAAATGTPGRTPFAPANNTTTPSIMNGSAIYNASQRPGRGNNLQQNKILEYFNTHAHSAEEGLSVAAIRSAIHGNARFDDDINELAQNGVIYTTVDENHYAVITE
uniref:Replication protein A C-terminal domain-containing protein n=1 Tax=Panagrolaimus sp. ES5 TaxID=591445 RepID=A0AC34F2C9_9BILA